MYSPCDPIADRIEVLKDFITRNGTNENVRAVLDFFEKRDPLFVNLDRNHCIVLAGGKVIGTPQDFPNNLSMEEYRDIKEMAAGKNLWVEDVSYLF